MQDLGVQAGGRAIALNNWRGNPTSVEISNGHASLHPKKGRTAGRFDAVYVAGKIAENKAGYHESRRLRRHLRNQSLDSKRLELGSDRHTFVLKPPGSRPAESSPEKRKQILRQIVEKKNAAAAEVASCRLHFAGLISDIDAERSRFIELQLGNFANSLDISDRLLLEDLHDEYSGRWAKDIRRHVREYEFQRGFVEHVAIDPTFLSGNAPDDLLLHPVVHVDLLDFDPVSFRNLVELAERDPSHNRLSKFFRGMLSLSADAAGLTDDDIADFAISPLFKDLAWISLRDNHLTEKAVQSILAATENNRSLNGPDIVHLDLSGNPFNPVQVSYWESGHEVDVLLPGEGAEILRNHRDAVWISQTSRGISRYHARDFKIPKSEFLELELWEEQHA